MPGFSRSLAELATLAGDALDARAAQVLLRAFSELHEELADQVTKAEFRELTATVQKLAEAQKRTELRVEELAEAQKRTELRVEELAEAQKRTELRVEELAEAQNRSEARLDRLEQAVAELAEAQRRTELRVEELARAQLRTEETVRQLVMDMKHVKEELGGLSHAVGYGLENLAYRTLPRLLRERFQLTLTEPLRRRFLPIGERMLEVNLWGLAARPDGQAVRVVGEAKTRLSAAKHFKGVERLLSATRPHWGTTEAFVVLLCHVALPGTEEEARTRGWWVVESWELEAPSVA
jgi:hypothetical protein